MQAEIVNKITRFQVLIPDGSQWDFAREVGFVLKEFPQQNADCVEVCEEHGAWIVTVYATKSLEEKFINFCENFCKVRNISFKNIFK